MANQNVVSIILKAFGAQETADAFKKPQNACEQLGASIKRLQSTIATFVGAIYSMRKAWEYAEMAAQFQEQKASLNALAAQYNTSANAIISNVQDAAKGLISLSDAAGVSAKALMMGLNPEQLTRFMQVVEATTNVTGQSVAQSFEMITEAAARGNERALKQLGIIVDLRGAYEQYAGSIGVAVNELTEQERQQMAVSAILEQSANIMARLGDSTDFVSDKMERFLVRVQDLKLAIGGLIIKVGGGLLGVFHAVDMALVEMAEAAIKPFVIIEKGLNMIGVKSDVFKNIAGTLKHTNDELYQGMMDSFAVMSSGADEASQTQQAAVQGMDNALAGHTERNANDRRKWMEWEWKYAEAVDRAGQEILDNLEKRDQAAREHARTLQATREAEIQLQLKEIDLAEQEFRISKSGAVEERVRLYEELKRIQEEYLAGLDKVNDPASWYAQSNAINETREALVRLNLELKEQTGTFTEGFSYGFQKFQHDAKTSFQYGQQAAQDTANAMQDFFSSISFDAMQGKLKSLGDYFRSFITSMQRSASQIFGQLATQGIMMGISALTATPTPGGPIMVHSGGYIPRFHAGGLSSDEVPAILQRGEYVINRRAVNAVGKSTLDNINSGRGAGRSSNNYFIVDPDAAEAYSKMSERQVEARITKLMKDNRLKQIRR